MKLAVALTFTAMLAGCGTPAPSVREQEATEGTSASALKGWDRLFGAPRETIGAINQAGFALGDYAAKDGRHVASGQPRMFSNSNAARPNMTSVVVAGASATTIDTVTYALALTDPVDATTARMRLAQTVGEFLGRFQVKATPDLLRAIRLGQPLVAPPASVAVIPSANDAPPRIDVTFTRAPATSPANSKTQG